MEGDKSKWGFITRLLHLDEIVPDGNSPFELYKKADIEHFKLEIHEISFDSELPAGIGLTEGRDKQDKRGRE